MKIASNMKLITPFLKKSSKFFTSSFSNKMKLSVASLIAFTTYQNYGINLEENLIDKELCDVNDLKEGEMRRF